MLHYIVLASVIAFALLTPAAGISITSPDSTSYVELHNTSIERVPAPVGYVNLDAGDAYGNMDGTTVLGYWADADNQSDVYCYTDAVSLVVQKDDDWRFVLDANYDYVAVKPPLRLQAQTANPPAVADNAQLYVKGSKLIAQYDDDGTIRYKYLDLAGSGTTWIHTTEEP